MAGEALEVFKDRLGHFGSILPPLPPLNDLHLVNGIFSLPLFHLHF